MSLTLVQLHELAWRFVPAAAADDRLYMMGPRSWWPAHEIGHFLVASSAECCDPWFGIDIDLTLSALGIEIGEHGYDVRRLCQSPKAAAIRYIIVREIGATKISQRLLRRAGHLQLAEEEIQHTDEGTLECSFEPWCKSALKKLLLRHRVSRLPVTYDGLEATLTRRARETQTIPHTSLRAARDAYAAAKEARVRAR